MRRVFFGCVATLALSAAGSALGGNHTWTIHEIFSSADGQVQYIELRECCGLPNEISLAGDPVNSLTNLFNFPANLVPPTSNKSILLATSAFAALPGAPAPDHTIVANFFSVAGPDTIEYNVLPYDTLSYAAGQLPTDGVTALDGLGQPVTNSPSNYAGATGSIVVPPPCPWDLDDSGTVAINDLLELLGNWGALYDINDLLDLLADWGKC